jgi:pyruvate kinase
MASDARGVVAIACFTQTGRTAALLSAERPPVPIVAFIPEARVRRASALVWGVRVAPAGEPADTDEMIGMMDEGLRSLDLARDGETVVMVASSPAGLMRTNMLKVHHVGAAER